MCHTVNLGAEFYSKSDRKAVLLPPWSLSLLRPLRPLGRNPELVGDSFQQRRDLARSAFEKKPSGSYAAEKLEDIKIGDREVIRAEWGWQ